MPSNCCLSSDTYLFAGPTLYLSDAKSVIVPQEIRLCPPARRGDIALLCEEHPPGVCILADGQFHQCAAVGHAEIRAALRLGWVVWGVSSLGALRACEMKSLGMRGYGQVFDQFVADSDFQDDEVALLHAAEWPHRPLSEPLVHFRAALSAFRAENLISQSSCETIAVTLKNRWYGERTIRCFAELVRAEISCDMFPVLERHLRFFDQYRVKSLDLSSFLYLKIWAHL